MIHMDAVSNVLLQLEHLNKIFICIFLIKTFFSTYVGERLLASSSMRFGNVDFSLSFHFLFPLTGSNSYCQKHLLKAKPETLCILQRRNLTSKLAVSLQMIFLRAHEGHLFTTQFTSRKTEVREKSAHLSH